MLTLPCPFLTPTTININYILSLSLSQTINFFIFLEEILFFDFLMMLLIYGVFDILVYMFSKVFKSFTESVHSFLSLFRSGVGYEAGEGCMKKRCHI